MSKNVCNALLFFESVWYTDAMEDMIAMKEDLKQKLLRLRDCL